VKRTWRNRYIGGNVETIMACGRATYGGCRDKQRNGAPLKNDNSAKYDGPMARQTGNRCGAPWQRGGRRDENGDTEATRQNKLAEGRGIANNDD